MSKEFQTGADLTSSQAENIGSSIFDDYIFSPKLTESQSSKEQNSKNTSSFEQTSILFENPYGSSAGAKLGSAFESLLNKKTRETADASETKTEPVTIEDRRNNLREMAEKEITDSKHLEKFQANLTIFEARANERNLPTEEIEATYKALERLLDAKKSTKWSLPMEERVMLAEQVASQAAKPTSINQGGYNTCNVTTVEVRTYSLHPGNAASLVAEVALTASYTAQEPKPKGTVVNIDARSLKPDAESRYNPPRDGERSLATQIFNIAAVNLVHKADRSNRVYGNDSIEGKEYLYSRASKSTVGHSPDLTDDQIVKAYDMINRTSRNTEPVVLLELKSNIYGEGKNCTTVETEEELLQKLSDAKRTGQLPIILGVSSQVEPFWTDSGHGAAGGSSGGHVVTVTDIEGSPAKVSIDNQWGSKADHLEKNTIPIHQLFAAMHTPLHAEELLAKEVSTDRRNGKFDAWKELEVTRLHHFNRVGEMQNRDKPTTSAERLAEDRDYTVHLKETIEKFDLLRNEQKKAGSLNKNEEERIATKTKDLINDPNLSFAGKVSISKLASDRGLIERSAFENIIGNSMMDISILEEKKPNKTEREKANNEYSQLSKEEGLETIKTLAKTLTADNRSQILDKTLNDDEIADRWKFALLLSSSKVEMQSEEQFVQRAAKLMEEFKQHRLEGRFTRQGSLEATQKQERLLISSLPAELVSKIRAYKGANAK